MKIVLHAVMRSNFVGVASALALPIFPGRQNIGFPHFLYIFPNFEGAPKYNPIDKGRQNIHFHYFLISPLSILVLFAFVGSSCVVFLYSSVN